MHLFQAALDTRLDSPLLASISVHGLHFTVYAASIAAFAGQFQVQVCHVTERAIP